MLQIQQQLYGYDNGHHLLASSCSLRPADRKRLEILSDYSGNIITPEFDGYLTGYPLVDSGFYALCMTWMAYELPRPGSVWTHVLLVPMQSDKYELLALDFSKMFVRPDVNKEQWLDEYRQQVTVCGQNNSLNNSDFSDIDCYLLRLLCDKTHKFVIPTDQPIRYIHALLSLFKRLGSNFFRNISFCTGSFVSKRGYDVVLDLQLAEKNTIRNVLRAKNEYTLIDLSYIKDLVTITAKTVRSSLDIVGFIQQGSITPEILSYVITLQERIQSRDTIAVIEMLKNSDMQEVSMYFGMLRELALYGLLQEQLFDGTCLEYFCNVDAHFDVVDYSKKEELVSLIRYLYAGLTTQEYATAVIQLLGISLNCFGESLLRELTRNMPKQAFEFILQNNPKCIRTLVVENWSFAKINDVWQSARSIQCDVLIALQDVIEEIPANEQKEILLSAISGHAYSIAPLLYRTFKENALEVLYAQIQDKKNGISRSWIPLFGFNAKKSLQLLGEEYVAEYAAAIFKQLNPGDPSVKEISINEWDILLDQYSKEYVSHEIKQEFAFFVLIAILSHSKAFPERIASYAFKSVHVILAKDKLEYDKWEKLDILLPRLEWHKMWDKCKRLRRAAEMKGYKFFS